MKTRRPAWVLVTIVMVTLASTSALLAHADPVTSSASASAVAPPGGTVLFGRFFGATERYFTATPDGRGPTQVFEAEDCAPCVALSPDGQRVMTPAVTDDDRLTTATIATDGTDRFVLDLPGRLLNLGPGAWSPDTRRLALAGFHPDASRTGIYLVRAADGSRLRQISASTSTDGAPHEPFAWSPDGARILLFVERGPLDSITHAGDLYLVRTDGSGLRKLNPDGVVVGRITIAGWPASWSPDGRSIAFAGFDARRDGARSAVFLASASQGRGRRLTGWGGVIASPSWSPTDDAIAFSELGGPVVSIVTSSGDIRRVSVPGQGICCPVWSPDGSHLLVRRAVGQAEELSVVDLDGDVISNVTRAPASYFGYDWA